MIKADEVADLLEALAKSTDPQGDHVRSRKRNSGRPCTNVTLSRVQALKEQRRKEQQEQLAESGK